MKPEDLKDCSDAELNLKLAELLGTADKWYILKRGLYYRPGGSGYTGRHEEAWTVSKEEAVKHEYKCGDPIEWVNIERAPIPRYASSPELCFAVEAALKADMCTDVTDRDSYYSQQMRYSAFLAKLIATDLSGAVPHARLFPFMHAEPRKRVIALICTLTKPNETQPTPDLASNA